MIEKVKTKINSTFDGSQIKIGNGAQAEVFLYKNYAYKIYKSSYPTEWIKFEKNQQKQINKLNLSPVKYYKTNNSNIIKMDFIDGITLEKYIQENPSSKDAFKILLDAFDFVHNTDISKAKIPLLVNTATMGMNEQDRTKVLPIINTLQNKYKPTICHLDLHFQNIMIQKNSSNYVIIDWINARIAPPVFDYARTYIIFLEFAEEVAHIYREAIKKNLQEKGISPEDFNLAVEASSLIRKQEKK